MNIYAAFYDAANKRAYVIYTDVTDGLNTYYVHEEVSSMAQARRRAIQLNSEVSA